MPIRTVAIVPAVLVFCFFTATTFLTKAHASDSETDRAPASLAQPVPVISGASQPIVNEAKPPAIDAKNFRVNAFFDMRFTAFRSEDSSINEKSRSGYLLEDGALYVNYEKEKLTAVIDLPFSRNGILAPSPLTSDLGFAKSKAQIYGKYAITPQFSATFGQFDTLYGVELNDSKDRMFGNVGLAYSQTLPVVHTGAYLAYTAGGLVARLMASNPSDRQTLGGTGDDASTEYGATVSYTNEILRGQLGYLTRAMTNLSGAADTRSLVDILAGATFGAFDLDLQYSVVNNPQKNTQTASATDKEDPGTALLALLTYKISDELRLGARYEKIDKDPGAAGYSDAQTFGGAVHYKVQDGFTLRLEYVDMVVKRKFAGDKYGESRFDLAALVGF